MSGCAAPRVLHVVESYAPVPSGYASRSRWIVEGQARLGISEPAVLVSSRQEVYGVDSVQSGTLAVERVSVSARERRRRRGAGGWLARPFSIDTAHLARQVAHAATRHAADIVHVHWSSNIGMAAARAAAALSIPLVAEVRFDLAAAMNAQTFNGRASWLEPLFRARFERHRRHACRIVSASHSLTQLIRQGLPTTGPPVCTIINGVDPTFGHACRRAQVAQASAEPAPSPRLTLGTTSKMLRYENLAAILRVLESLPDADAVFVGDGPERRRLQSAAARFNRDRERVRFAGRLAHADVPAALAAIDIFMVPRRGASITRFASPIKVVEAMAARRAIVATDVGDIGNLLDQGRGLVVPPDDQSRLTAAVRHLADDPTLRNRLGRAAGDYAVDNLDGDALLQRYRDVYAQCVGARVQRLSPDET